MKKIIALVLVFTMIFFAACSSQEKEKIEEKIVSKQIETVKLSSQNYLVDKNGMTLYYFTKDINGESYCQGECLEKWPVFYEENISVNSNLNKSDFGEIIREDGTKQTTYQGWPLYYFFMDKAPLEMKGEGVNNIWFVMKPSYTLLLANDAENGDFLVDKEGLALYYFTKDSINSSKCEGECLEKWPVFYEENIQAPSSINLSNFNSIVTSQGDKITTYKGKPLYYFFMDSKKGDINGNGVNGVWFLIKP